MSRLWKYSSELVTFLLLTIVGLSRPTKITKTSAEIIFEPMGSIIPELSWANIRITLNLTTMFEENNDLCKAHSQLRSEGKHSYQNYTRAIPTTEIIN